MCYNKAIDVRPAARFLLLLFHLLAQQSGDRVKVLAPAETAVL
jgi:hypothetical protein